MSVLVCIRWSMYTYTLLTKAFPKTRLGDTLHVVRTEQADRNETCHQPDQNDEISVTNKINLLIMHPDLLMPVTAVATASQCLRRSLVTMMMHSSSDITPSLVWGNMLHSIMQACLVEGKWDEEFTASTIDRIAKGGLSDLVRIGVSMEDAKAELGRRAVGIKEFCDKYVGPEPKVRFDSLFVLSKHNLTNSQKTR